MRIGVVFPQTEMGSDPGAIRAYAAAVEDLGYRHVLAYDHVIGADPEAYPGWSGPYDIDTTFHEPMVLYGFLAAISSLELVTGIIILPQRQTVLVAKQAAQVDLLTGGRLRLGVGIGWNRVEYEALGQDFSQRGRRLAEQVDLLRRLWTQRSVTFSGGYDTVTAAGIAPPPVQRPIPVWFGAQSPAAYRRAGRLADGWFPQMQPGPELDEAKRVIERAATEAGRDPARLGMEGRVSLGAGGADGVARDLVAWRDAGATHVSVNTMRAGLSTVDQHIAALAAVAGTGALKR
ncbi:MAG TPA: LLM class F420-dependent oxidoreductase [Rugosimonospora sp.]